MTGGTRSRRNPQIGYVPQKIVLEADMPLRARDLVGLGLDGHRFGISRPAAKRRIAVEEMLDAVGATRFADARIGNLSGGEQQRVMIAQALICRPKLLLLDEPLANLDIRSAAEVVELLARIAAEQRIAILLSAHDMNPLLPVMDRVVYLADGRAASGTTDEVVRTETLSRLYGHHVEVIHVQGRVLVVSGAEHQAHHAGDTDPFLRGAVMLVAASWSPLFEPGFFSSEPVQVALVVGAIAAVVSGIVGVFTVIRGQSFAGHALSDIGTAGGSAAFLVGASTLYGFVAFNVVAAGVMELIGIRKPRGRDLATGIVLGASLGLAALFLYEGTITLEHHRGHRERAVRVHLHPAARHHHRHGRPRRRLGGVDRRLVPAPPAQLRELRAGRGAPGARPPGRRRLSPGPGVGGVDVRGHDRGDPLDGPVDRTGRHRTSGGDPHRGRHRGRRRGRRVRLLGGDVDRLRQHRLGWREWLAGQLLHRGRHLRPLLRLGGRRPPPSGIGDGRLVSDQPTAVEPVEVA